MNRDPLEVERLIPEDKRRVSVHGHHQFREGITRHDDRFDEIDMALDDHIEIDPYVTGTNNRRSDRELSKMLELIDNLPISENGKDGHE